MRVIDLGDCGEITVIGEWNMIDCVSGYKQCWEVKAQGLIMNDWAENLGIPHGTVVIGKFWACSDDDETNPEKAEWLEFGFDEFEIIEISPDLVDALAEAVSDILADQEITKEDLADPDTAESVWSQAWKELKEGKYGSDWVTLDKMLIHVRAGEVENLAYKKL